MVAVAAARMPHARVVQGEAVPLPFDDRALTIVTTGHFYGHLLPAEREAFLAEARPVAPEQSSSTRASTTRISQRAWPAY